MNRLPTIVLNAACLTTVALAATAGCNDQPKQPPYGSQMSPSSTSMSSDSTPMPTVVPAGAQRLSQGTYNQIQFQVPSGDGLLYVFDMTTNKVVGVTNSVGAEMGRSMTMADLKNTAQGLSMTDQYEVFFAPSMPTTKPIGGSGM